MFKLPQLPYSPTALAPFLTAETFEFHYGKHHKTYIDKMNDAIKGTPDENKSLEELVKTTQGGLFNNAAQSWNHTFYWLGFSEKGTPLSDSGLKKAIDETFGGMEAFQKTFNEKTAAQFGSGWGWLVKTSAGKLQIKTTGNAENPITQGDIPLLTCDVWEHAYYIDYRNARPKYLEAFWKHVDWSFVAKNFNSSSVPNMTVTMK
jgi:Fe-Mn family superoxide dismutase